MVLLQLSLENLQARFSLCLLWLLSRRESKLRGESGDLVVGEVG